MVEMAGSPCIFSKLVKLGDVFDGWNGGLIKGEPDFSVKITHINNFIDVNPGIYFPGICNADIDCEIKIRKGPFVGTTMTLSSVGEYKLVLMTFPSKNGILQPSVIQLERKIPPKRNAPVEKSPANKPLIEEIIILQKTLAANGAAAVAGGAGLGGGKRKNRRGTKRVRRTRRRSSRRH